MPKKKQLPKPQDSFAISDPASPDALWKRLNYEKNKYQSLLRCGRLDRFIKSTEPKSHENPAEYKVRLLFEAARTGCCRSLKSVIPDDDFVNRSDEHGVTALHIATEYSQYEDVKFLLEAGAKVTEDHRGSTPLHIAASSSQPNPEIAKMLIQHMNPDEGNQSLINKVYTSENGTTYTALHFAAVNKHISHEFIRTLEKINPSIKNNQDDTAFHMAAELENPDVIIFMLDVFSPAESGWDMESIEGERKPTQLTLLEICAKRGNAAAVAKLIKYGAQISKQVLFELIDESVNNPTKTDKLIAVYRTIIENYALWDCLRKRSKSETSQLEPRPDTAPKRYRERQRKIMLGELGLEKVVKYAIEKGDKMFLLEIVNTPGVFRIEEDGDDQTDTRCRSELQYESTSTSDTRRKRRYAPPTYIKYDVTNFLTPSYGYCAERPNAVAPTSQPSEGAEDEHSPSYLRLIVENKRLWATTDILLLEPFRSITQPICGFVQLCYLLMALIQLLHIIVFSVLYMSSYCDLKHRLNLNSLAQCNISTIPPGSIEVNVSQLYIGINCLWLIWPTFLFLEVLDQVLHRSCHHKIYALFSARFAYALIVWAWYFNTFVFHDLNLSLTSVVLLYGWLVTLSLFVKFLKNVSIFSFLLTEIIVQDILSLFGIVFLFVLIGFSSAIHLLRESALLGQKNYLDTLYNVFAAALTTGEFMEETFGTSSDGAVADNVYRIHFLQTIFAIYLCCTTIIMLNILITIMNNRYEKARKKAKNVWRRRSVRVWMRMVQPVWMRLSSLFGSNVLRSFCCYWKFIVKIRKFFDMVNTHEVSIAVEHDGTVFLHLEKIRGNANNENQQQRHADIRPLTFNK